jgi:G3E family GTPase
MAEERTFTQEEVNQIVEERIARAREKWAKESESSAESENLKAELQARDEELSNLRREQFLKDAQRDVRAELARLGVTDEGRIKRIEKFIDFSEASDSSFVVDQVQGLARDVPELFPNRGAGSRGSKKPVLTQEKPLTREQVEAMSPEEVNSNWDRVKAFLGGERS